MRIGKLLLALTLFAWSACGREALPGEALAGQQGQVLSETATWTVLGTGVNYRNTGAGDNVFIGYAGYQVTDAEAESWTNALSAAQLGRLGVGHLYAVRGPDEVTYVHREIGNTKLIHHLLGVTSSKTKLVVVASHSSGSYVANELFGFLFDGHMDTVGRTPGRTVYYNLDGGDGLTAYTLTQLADAYFVHAYDNRTGTSSPNASGMIALGHRSPPKTAGLTITADAAGCASGAVWCVHMVMITQHPHSSTSADLLDYSDFSGRPVQDSYLLQTWSTLTGLLSH
jgi:hypothetical protein